MFKNYRWFILPLLSVVLTAWALISAQKELLMPQQINYSTKITATANGPESQQQISDATMSELITARQQTSQLIKNYGIGQLIIPTADINLPIYNTPNNLTLSSGVAKYFAKGAFLTGNTILAAHNFADSPVLLYNIKNLKVDDKIYITDYHNLYEYKTTGNQVVNETQTEVLNQTTNPTLTLIRCVGPVGTSKRLVVTASLVAKSPLSVKQKQSWSITSSTSPSVKKLSFVAQGLADSYRQHFLNWRLLLVIIVNILFIIIAIYFSLHHQNKNA